MTFLGMNQVEIFKVLTKGMKFDLKKEGNREALQRYGLLRSKKPEAELHGTSQSEELVKNEPIDEAEQEDGEDAAVSKKRKKKQKKKSPAQLLALKQESINQQRNENNIHVSGADIPPPLTNFESLTTEYNVNRKIVDNLSQMGYQTPTPVQMQVWPLMLRDREVLAFAPTGSGKTASFLVPILQKLGGPKREGFRALIVSPTRELANQIHKECELLSENLGLRAYIISNIKRAREKFGPKSAKKFDILVTTPNQLVYLLKEEVVSLAKVEWLVVDECDRLMEDGIKGFRDQLAALLQACTAPGLRRTLFSATYSYEVEKWCKYSLDNAAMITIGARNAASSDVKQELRYCGDDTGKMYALKDLLRTGFDPPILVFVQTKQRALELFKEIVMDDIYVAYIHAGLTKTARDKTVKAFRERKLWVLICTELMARGLDFKGVNMVVNYDFPPTTASYIHRVGRTGRANRPGRSVTYWDCNDKPLLPSIARIIKASGGEVPEWMLEMSQKKKDKKKFALKQPDRGHVSLDVVREKKEKRRKKQMINQSKKRKVQKGDDDAV